MPPKIPLPKVYAGPVTPGPKATVNAGFVSQLADNLGTFVGIFNPWKRAQEKRVRMSAFCDVHVLKYFLLSYCVRLHLKYNM